MIPGPLFGALLGIWSGTILLTDVDLAGSPIGSQGDPEDDGYFAASSIPLGAGWIGLELFVQGVDVDLSGSLRIESGQVFRTRFEP